MQHRVLSVDLSCEPARLVLAAVENRSVEVLEACEYHLGPNSGDLFSATPENSEHTDDSDAAASNGSFGQDNVEAESDTIILARELTGTEKLANMLEQINGTWSSAVVIVPSDDYMHLEVEMPFNDQKQLQKILHHEVQDQVPFDVSNFHLMPGTITADGLNSYRVHVGIADREKVANLIANCKESGFEPIVVSPSCSVPAAIYALAPDYFADSSAVVWAEGPHYTITVRIDGEIKSQRVLMPLSRYSQNGSQESGTIDPRTSIPYQELKLTIAAAERDFSTTLDAVYIFTTGDVHDFQKAFGRPVERVTVGELVKARDNDTQHSGPQQNSLAALAAIFGAPEVTAGLSTNYRSGEFAYRPQFREFLAGLHSLRWYAAAVLTAFVVSWVIEYWSITSQIQSGYGLMRERIQAEMPSFEAPPGQEKTRLENEIALLDSELESLGSVAGLSPLDLFLEVSKTLPATGAGIKVHGLNIKSSKIKLEGFAPNYGAIDALEAALKKNKKILCDLRVKDSPSRGSGRNKVGFEVTLKVCSSV